MRSITLLAPNFTPESNAGAKRITALAYFLLDRGWNVTVITQLPHHPQNRIHDGFDGRSPQVSQEGALTVIRLRPWIVAKDNLALRLLSESLFTVLALPHLLRSKADVMFASSPYMFLGPAALAVARLKRIPFAWDVRDLIWLYPRAAGKRTFGLDRPLEFAMKRTARGAALLTTATEGLLAYFERRPERAAVVHNGVTLEVFSALEALPPPKFAPGVRPRVAYVGLFGYNHGVMNIVDAANMVPEADFVIMGDGPDRDTLKEAAKDSPNIRIAAYQPFSELTNVYANSEVLVSHVRRNPIFKWSQPAKIWEYMATGRPVIHAGEGEAIDLLSDHQIGVPVPPEDPAAIAAAIRTLLADPDKAREIGSRGREFVRSTRLRENSFEVLASHLDELVGKQR